MTKRQRQQARRERVRAEMARKEKRAKRRTLLTRGGVTLLVLLVLGGAGLAVREAQRPVDQSGPANMISGGAVFTSVDGKAKIVETPAMAKGADPVPTDPKKLDAPARIVSYLDFGCEFCKAFEDANSQQIEQMVAAGDATLEVQPVAITGPYAVRSGSAMSCVAAKQPDSFFAILRTMYANQPDEGGTLTNQEILDMWSGAGIEASSELKSCVEAERYSDWIQTRTEVVASDPAVANPETGGFGTPTIFVNDERYTPKDLGDPAEFKKFVEDNSDGVATGEGDESGSQ